MHPRRFLGAPLPCSIFLCLCVLYCLPGCGTAPIPGSENSSRTLPGDAEGSGGELTGDELNLADLFANVPPVQNPVFEPAGANGTFESATFATVPQDGEITIEGTIDAITDIDLYALGPALAGDRIIIDVAGHNGINTVAALFDGNGDLIDANNDRSYYAGQLDPFIARVIRETTPQLFLGIAVSSAQHFASNAGQFDTGSYSVRVRRDPDEPVPEIQHQIVFVDFLGGAQVQIGLEPTETMSPFSAEAISSRFAGQTEYIGQLMMDMMRLDFAAYDVTILDSFNHARPSDVHTTLYVGNFNASFLGLADNVDTGNAFLEQEAIVYAEDLSMYEVLQPTAEEAAQALANIASHELGHLLGLEHTQTRGDLMATASSALDIFELDGVFGRERLQASIFPAGWQNSPHLLLLNVGPNTSADASRLRLMDLLPKASQSWRDGLDWSHLPQLQGCNLCAQHN